MKIVGFGKRLLSEIVGDDIPGMAAQCAYALVFALFPFLLLLAAIASFLPSQGPTGPIPPEYLQRVPPQVADIITARIHDIAAHRSGGALGFAIVTLLYSCSSGMATIVTGVNRAYDVKEQRAFWKRLLIGLLLTLAGIVLVFVPALWGAIGSEISRVLAHFGLGTLGVLVVWLRWPVIAIGAFAWLTLLFRVAPETQHHWRPFSPGAFFAVIALIAANWGLSFYVSSIANMSATYGAIGGFIVLLLWLYVSSFVLLFAAEINAVLRHAREQPTPPSEERAKEAEREAPAGGRLRPAKGT